MIEDLLAGKSFSGYNYTIVHKDSPDRRGIDCALLLSDNFKVRAVPTFTLMRGNVFVDETSGSDILKVHALLKKHLPSPESTEQS